MARGQRGTADVLAGEFEFVAEGSAYDFQHTNGFFGDFRADAVSGDDGQIQKHRIPSRIKTSILQKDAGFAFAEPARFQRCSTSCPSSVELLSVRRASAIHH